MGKNVGIGGKKKKQGKKFVQQERELALAEEMQAYGQIIRQLGDGRMEVQCLDNVKRMAHIRGKMKKKVWMVQGDVVLVSLREYEEDKCDIILKYTEAEVRQLKNLGQIPESIKLPENEKQNENENDGINFFDEEEDDSEEEEDNKGKKNTKKQNNKKDLPSSDSEDEDEIDIDDI